MAFKIKILDFNRIIRIMEFKTLENLAEAGFGGFVPVSKLKADGIHAPEDSLAEADLCRPGVYMVVRTDDTEPVFVPEGSGGHFKGRNPNVPVGELQANWVKDTCVVYIGKAGGGSSRATLRKRIGQYIRFGSGEPVGHWGGRYIWQLEDADNLLFCWRAAIEWEDAEEIESELIENFKSRYDGHRPFANLKD